MAKNAFLGTEQSMLQLDDMHDDGGTSPASPSCWFEDALQSAERAVEFW